LQANATSALAREAHALYPEALPVAAKIVNRCLYNYQREHRGKCGTTFACEDVVAIHKGHTDEELSSNKSDSAFCAKPKYHSGLPKSVV
jgi:hypothetical protein